MKIRLLGLILLSSWACYGQTENRSVETDAMKIQRQREEFEFLKTYDPRTGTIPKERLYEQIEMLSQKEEMINSTARVDTVAATDKWFEIGPINKGGRIRSMIVLNNNGQKLAFAGGASGGLWTCGDISVSNPQWRRVNDYWDNLNISCIVAHPTNSNILFLGTGSGWINPVLTGNSATPSSASLVGGGIWRSTDKGKTWQRLNSSKGSDFQYIQRIIFDNSGRLYVGTLVGLFRSTGTAANAGGNFATGTQAMEWDNVFSSMTVKSVADIEKATNGMLFASTGIGEKGKIYRSSNGTIWDEVPLPGGMTIYQRIELATTPNKSNVLFASIEGQSSLRCIIRTDSATKTQASGITWNNEVTPTSAGFSPSGVIEGAWNHNTLIVDPNTQANTPLSSIKVYAGYEDIWRSTNGGTNWVKISTNTAIHVDQHWFVFEPGNNNKMYICNDGGIYRCDNINASSCIYSPINSNLFVTQFYTCAGAETTNVYLGGSQDNSTIYHY